MRSSGAGCVSASGSTCGRATTTFSTSSSTPTHTRTTGRSSRREPARSPSTNPTILNDPSRRTTRSARSETQMSELADWTRYVAHTAREDGDVDLAQLTGEPFTTEELARLYVQAEAWATAAGKVKAAIGQALLGVVDKPVEVDGWLVWKGEKRKEVCVDPEGFAEWLTQHPELAGRL